MNKKNINKFHKEFLIDHIFYNNYTLLNKSAFCDISYLKNNNFCKEIFDTTKCSMIGETCTIRQNSVNYSKEIFSESIECLVYLKNNGTIQIKLNNLKKSLECILVYKNKNLTIRRFHKTFHKTELYNKKIDLINDYNDIINLTNEFAVISNYCNIHSYYTNNNLPISKLFEIYEYINKNSNFNNYNDEFFIKHLNEKFNCHFNFNYFGED